MSNMLNNLNVLWQNNISENFHSGNFHVNSVVDVSDNCFTIFQNIFIYT